MACLEKKLVKKFAGNVQRSFSMEDGEKAGRTDEHDWLSDCTHSNNTHMDQKWHVYTVTLLTKVIAVAWSPKLSPTGLSSPTWRSKYTTLCVKVENSLLKQNV